MSVRLVVIGGFLGAGKTSSILKMGKILLDSGKKVGIVTNDQGEDLVDTHFLGSEGLAVFEVTKGCFCCNFDEFTNKLNKLSKTLMPDIILAEPVGSCTDLVATIFKPILNNFTKEFVMSPLSIVVDPRRVLKFMNSQKEGAFINEVNYLFDKQISEGDVIALNKCDLLPETQIQTIKEYLEAKYKGAKVVTISALTGDGIQEWFNEVAFSQAPQKESLDIDYDIYAKAEAALGWLNNFATIETPEKIDVSSFIENIIENIRGKLKLSGNEIAHLKVYAVTSTDFSKAGITSIDDEISFNRKMQFDSQKFNIIINARVEINPQDLEIIATSSLNSAVQAFNAEISNIRVDCFSPSYPKPMYRM